MKGHRQAACVSAMFCTAFLYSCLPSNLFAGIAALPSARKLFSPFQIALSLADFKWIPWLECISGAFIIAGISVVMFHWQQKRFRKQADQLENLVSARTLELAMANADLERLSVTDPLTGMKNRRFVEFSIVEDLARVRRAYQCVQGEWQSITEESSCIHFLLIDIDNFKSINDRYGHPAGDQILRQMGPLCSSMVRESDTVVRWGGEEFLIIARNPKGNDLSIMAERIRKQVESARFAINDQTTISITCSIGFSSWPFFKADPDAIGWADVIGIADHGLYMAKRSGRNTWFGIFSHPDYKGKIHPNLLTDLVLAEKQGIIRIQAVVSLNNIIPPQTQQQKVTYPIHAI
jgi:diguanylate cyclase (GGDEF)-like protein